MDYQFSPRKRAVNVVFQYSHYSKPFTNKNNSSPYVDGLLRMCGHIDMEIFIGKRSRLTAT